MYLQDLRASNVGEYKGGVVTVHVDRLGDLHVYTNYGFHIVFSADEAKQLADILMESGKGSDNG